MLGCLKLVINFSTPFLTKGVDWSSVGPTQFFRSRLQLTNSLPLRRQKISGFSARPDPQEVAVPLRSNQRALTKP